MDRMWLDDMKIIYKSMAEKTVKLMAETLDDLWHLEKILEPGDEIKARTFRKTVIKTGGELKYGEKRPVVLTIKAEKVELNKDSGLLRITGPIIDGPEDMPRHSYHTIEVEVGTTLSIIKQWRPHHIERLEKAKVKKPLLLICVMDRDSADLATLMESGLEMKAQVTNTNREEKGEKSKGNREDYYKEVLNIMEAERGRYQKIIVAGPGFERENFFKYARDHKSPVAPDIILERSSETGINGIREVVEKSTSRVLQETRMHKESGYVDDLLSRLKTNKLVVYGPKETRRAVEMGAVDTLLVSEQKIGSYEDLMDTAEKQGGHVVVIGSDHERGAQFLHLGGIAGFLRYEIE